MNIALPAAARTILVTIMLLLPIQLFGAAQALTEIQPPENLENIHVVKLDTDKHSSAFVIFVKQGVRAHIHERHSETLYFLDGEGEFQLGDQVVAVSAGSFIQVPEGVVHGVKVTSATPLKALSIQAPEFFGKDRVFLE